MVRPGAVSCAPLVLLCVSRAPGSPPRHPVSFKGTRGGALGAGGGRVGSQWAAASSESAQPLSQRTRSTFPLTPPRPARARARRAAPGVRVLGGPESVRVVCFTGKVFISQQQQSCRSSVHRFIDDLSP